MRCVLQILLTFALLLALPARAADTPLAGGDRIGATTNSNTLGLIASDINGSSVQIAAEVAAVLEGSGVRVVPMVGRGAVQNITDLLYLRNVDLAIVQADVLDAVRKDGMFRDIEQRIHYIAPLYDHEVHVLVRGHINRLADLNDRPVSIGPPDSGSALTARQVFERAGVRPRYSFDDQATALERLRNNQIDALFFVTGKPAPLFLRVAPGEDLHFLDLPLTDELKSTYRKAQLAYSDYPNLVRNGETVSTLAVSAVLAAYNWDYRGSSRHPRAQRQRQFIGTLFERYEQFLQPARHGKWFEFHPEREVAGWTRAAAAGQWLAQHAGRVVLSAPKPAARPVAAPTVQPTPIVDDVRLQRRK